MTTVQRRSDYITSGEHRLHLDIWRHEGDYPVLLFISGTGAHAAYYCEFHEKLAAERFTIVGLNPRGHGKSGGGWGGFSFDELLDDVDNTVAYSPEADREKITR